VAFELDCRISNSTNRDGENSVEELLIEQREIWRVLENCRQDRINEECTAPINQSSATNLQPVNNSIAKRTSVADRASTIADSGKLKRDSRPKKASKSVTVDDASPEEIQTLLLQQKNISVREIELEEQSQRQLTSELLELTSILKESTTLMNETINIQNKQLAEIFEHAEENVEELDEQKENMNKQQQLQAHSVWTTVWTLVTVFVTFSMTYAVIRMFPKP